MAIDFNLLKKTEGIDQDLLQSVQDSPFQGTAESITPTILSSNTGKKTNQTNLDSLANIEDTITVQSGETLGGIAQREGVDVKDIGGFRSGDPNLIFPGEQLTIRGTSPATTSMIGAINQDLQDGTLSSADIAKLKESEANLLEATAKANALRDKPVELNEAMKSIEDFRTQLEQDLADLFKERGVLREQREKLAVPSTRNIEIQRQLSDLTSRESAFNLQTQKDKFDEFSQQTLSFARGRAAELDIKASFRRQEFALERQNLLSELGLEQAAQDAAGKSIEQQISDFEEDFELKRAVEERILQFEDDILDRADKVSDEAKETLSTFLGSLEGFSFEDISPESQREIERLANISGLDISLVKDALRVSKQRAILERTSEGVVSAGEEDVTPVGISPVTGKAFTDGQTNSGTFAVRMEIASESLDEKVFRDIAFFGIQALKSNERRQFEQAEKNFVTGQLRKESGAAISAEEFVDARLIYIPQFGDDEETLAQKELARKIALQGMINASVGAYEQLKGTTQNETDTVIEDGESFTSSSGNVYQLPN
ncbi:MAG TPA: hypothetical protein ENI23_03290 [bacterium]|nr:hypothetical protein [bacterium]